MGLPSCPPSAAGFGPRLRGCPLHGQPPTCHSAHLEECLLSSSSCLDHFHSRLGFPTPAGQQRCPPAEICCCWQDQRTDGLNLKEKNTLRDFLLVGLRCFRVTVRREMPGPGYQQPFRPPEESCLLFTVPSYARSERSSDTTVKYCSQTLIPTPA